VGGPSSGGSSLLLRRQVRAIVEHKFEPLLHALVVMQA